MSEEPRWPRYQSQQEVRNWIASVLPTVVEVEGPTQLYGTKGWGVTARFETRSCDQSRYVIYKSCNSSLFSPGPLYASLSRCCPGLVPELLAWRQVNYRADALFRPFMGRTVAEMGELQPLLEMARSLAQIQARVASQPAETLDDLPRFPLNKVPLLLDRIIEDIQRKFWPLWEQENCALLKRFDVPKDLIPQLLYFSPKLWDWVAELEAGGWPESVDHVDFLPHNALVQKDGPVLIYDWEQAVLGCPFFSLDVLLAFAQDYEQNFAEGLEIRSERETESTQALRRAYVEALPWGTLAERERAFDVAMCLSPIRYAYAEGVLARKLRQEEVWAEDMAWWITRALCRWQRMDR